MKSYRNRFLFLFMLILVCFSISSKAVDASLITNHSYHIQFNNINSAAQTTIHKQQSITKKELLIRIKKVIVKELDVKAENIKMQSRFIEDLGADDLSAVELTMAFEEEFKISITDDDAGTLTTVQKAYDYLIRKLKVKQ